MKNKTSKNLWAIVHVQQQVDKNRYQRRWPGRTVQDDVEPDPARCAGEPNGRDDPANACYISMKGGNVWKWADKVSSDFPPIAGESKASGYF